MAPSVCQIGSLTLSVPIIGTKSRVESVERAEIPGEGSCCTQTGFITKDLDETE